MEEYIQIIILGIIQGIAEFLPISSSGHLQLAADIFNWSPEESTTMSILLHAGTLLAIIIFYFKTLLNILLKKEFKLIVQIISATLPVVILGMIYKIMKFDEFVATQPIIVGICFIITGLILIVSEKKHQESFSLKNLNFKNALLIGTTQAIAILPGISRSGSTIGAALKLGLKRDDAARFSFLLAIPAIGGATFLEIISMLKNSSQATNNDNMILYAYGFIVSFIVGLISLKALLAILKKGKLKYFSYYLFILGSATILYSAYKIIF